MNRTRSIVATIVALAVAPFLMAQARPPTFQTPAVTENSTVAATTAYVRGQVPSRPVTSFGADRTGLNDSTAAFGAASGPGQFDIPAGTYKLTTIPTLVGGMPYIHPNVTFTGDGAAAFSGSSGYPFFGWTDANTYGFNFPGGLRQIHVNKSASGAPSGSGSDGHYAVQWNVWTDNVVQDPSQWYAVNSIGNLNWIIRGEAAPVLGTGVADINLVYVKDVAQIAGYNGESEAGNDTVIANSSGINAGHNWWGRETNVRGSATGASRLIVGQSIVVQNPAPQPTRNAATGYPGQIGQSIFNAPGAATFPIRAGDTFTGMTFRPLDRGLVIGGFSGLYPTFVDGVLTSGVVDGNDAGADYAFQVGLDVGGNYGPWTIRADTAAFWGSKLREGMNVHQYTDYGLRIFGKHPYAATGVRSLQIDSTAGPAQFDVPVTISGFAPSFIFNDTGGATNQQKTALLSYLGGFVIQQQNDDGSFRRNVMTVDASTGSSAFTAPVQFPALTVAGLGTCNSGKAGSVAYVTDATSPTYNATLTGGGSVKTLGMCNGTNWTAH